MMPRWARVAVACVFLGLQAASFYPMHEYGHCLVGFALGVGAGDCEAHYVDHFIRDGRVDRVVQPWDALEPWWEHPLIYGMQGIFMALGLWLALEFVGRGESKMTKKYRKRETLGVWKWVDRGIMHRAELLQSRGLRAFLHRCRLAVRLVAGRYSQFHEVQIGVGRGVFEPMPKPRVDESAAPRGLPEDS